MITLIICITVVGFIFTYYTSKRIQIADSSIRVWAKENAKKSNLIGVVLMITGLFSSMYALGVTSGTLSFLVILMTMASLTVITYPINFFSIRTVVVLVILSLIIEISLP